MDAVSHLRKATRAVDRYAAEVHFPKSFVIASLCAGLHKRDSKDAKKVNDLADWVNGENGFLIASLCLGYILSKGQVLRSTKTAPLLDLFRRIRDSAKTLLEASDILAVQILDYESRWHQEDPIVRELFINIAKNINCRELNESEYDYDVRMSPRWESHPLFVEPYVEHGLRVMSRVYNSTDRALKDYKSLKAEFENLVDDSKGFHVVTRGSGRRINKTDYIFVQDIAIAYHIATGNEVSAREGAATSEDKRSPFMRFLEAVFERIKIEAAAINRAGADNESGEYDAIEIETPLAETVRRILKTAL